MPIALPDALPAAALLRGEGIAVRSAPRPNPGTGRPLEIAILNLMPDKIGTETQLARRLGQSRLEVAPTLLIPATHRPKTAPHDHIRAFYQPWTAVRHRRFDGLIITGAPIERLAFEAVRYWPEMVEILDWSRSHVFGCYYLCWAGQAALWHFYGVPKVDYGVKLSGVYPHRRRVPARGILAGFDTGFAVPVSRWTGTRGADIAHHDDLIVLADSEQSGLALLQDRSGRLTFMFNHLEYDRLTLGREYRRDLLADPDTPVPANYFPGDDPDREPAITWDGDGRRIYGNWLAFLHRHGPARLADIGPEPDAAAIVAQ